MSSRVPSPVADRRPGVRRAAIGLLAAGTLAAVPLTVVPAAHARKSGYSHAFDKAFGKSCSRSAIKKGHGKISKHEASLFCHATLRCVEAKLTARQFASGIKELTDGRGTPSAKVIAKCEKSAAKKLK